MKRPGLCKQSSSIVIPVFTIATTSIQLQNKLFCILQISHASAGASLLDFSICNYDKDVKCQSRRPWLLNFKGCWDPEIIRYFSSLSFYFDHVHDKRITQDLQAHTASPHQIKYKSEIPTHGVRIDSADKRVLWYFYCCDKKWSRPWEPCCHVEKWMVAAVCVVLSAQFLCRLFVENVPRQCFWKYPDSRECEM